MFYWVVAGIYSIVNLILAVVIYAKSPKTVLSQFFFFCVLCMIAMGLGTLTLEFDIPQFAVRSIEILIKFIYSLLPFFFLHFVVIFVRRFDILQSKSIVLAIYVAGLFSYTMVIAGLIHDPMLPDGQISQSGLIFYLTWMTIFFAIGIAMLYEIRRKFYEKPGRSNLLMVTFVLLLLILPGPFTESVFFNVFGLKADIYYITSTFAVLIAVYFVFRYKIIVNTFYDSLKSALAVVNDIFITMDNQFRIEMAKGTAVASLLEYRESELHGKPITEIIEHSSFLEEYKFHLSQQKMKQNYFDSNVITKSGIRIPMNISFTPITVSGQTTGFVSIFRDMRERRELEEQLRHAHKMKSLGTLAGGIAHDFNNILQIILLNTSRLKDSERVDSGRLAKVVEVNEQAIQRGTELVRQILTFARKTDVTFTVFKLQDFFPKFLMMMKETFPRTINFDLKQDPELPPIFADQNQINQVFLNLCVNARDAMPEGGTIAIQCELRDGTLVKQRFDNAVETYYVCIALSDTGSGMDRSTLARIYEPFFTTKDPGKGTGLGLAVVYGIIEGHQGFLDVKSTVGVGTTFSIYLPLSKTHMVSAEEINDEVLANSRGDETILVIEDEPYLLETLCSLLRVQGYRVIPATDGYEAVEIYRDRHEDVALVITDLGLPKLNGWDAFLRMKELNQNVRTIISTGYVDPKMKEEKTEPGIVDFIQKPYRPATILRSVRKALNEKNTISSLPAQS